MSIGLSDRVRRVKGHASRNVNGEALVVLTQQRQLHRLNPVGTRIWELCGDPEITSVAEIVRSIVREFEVDQERAQQDVCEFLGTMLQLGAIEVVSLDAGVAGEGGT
jgi:hypothetical protein